jgi:hypothetical protein
MEVRRYGYIGFFLYGNANNDNHDNDDNDDDEYDEMDNEDDNYDVDNHNHNDHDDKYKYNKNILEHSVHDQGVEPPHSSSLRDFGFNIGYGHYFDILQTIVSL